MLQKIYNEYGIDCFLIDGTAYIGVNSIRNVGFFDKIGVDAAESILRNLGAKCERFAFISEELFEEFVDSTVNISSKVSINFKDMIFNLVIPEVKKRYTEYDKDNECTYECVNIYPKPLKADAKKQRHYWD